MLIVHFQGGVLGHLFDTFGPRVLIIIGSVVHVASIMLVSACHTYIEILLAQGFLFGIGVGLM